MLYAALSEIISTNTTDNLIRIFDIRRQTVLQYGDENNIPIRLKLEFKIWLYLWPALFFFNRLFIT